MSSRGPMRLFKAVVIGTQFTGEGFSMWSLQGMPRQEFRVGETYTVPGEGVEMCERGFHGCVDLRHVFLPEFGYSFPRGDPVLEVEAEECVTDVDRIKTVAKTIRVLRIMPREEVIAAMAIPMLVSEVLESGCKLQRWFKNGVLHNDDSSEAGWAYKSRLGTWWLKDGYLHREGGQPACIEHFARKLKLGDFLVHRGGDPPAIVDPINMEWWVSGRLHRDGDKPAVIVKVNTHRGIEMKMEWWVDGVRHRDFGRPAVVWQPEFGRGPHPIKEWWVNGRRHRGKDKPAVVLLDKVRYWSPCDTDGIQLNPTKHYEGATRLWYTDGVLQREESAMPVPVPAPVPVIFPPPSSTTES